MGGGLNEETYLMDHAVCEKVGSESKKVTDGHRAANWDSKSMNLGFLISVLTVLNATLLSWPPGLKYIL